MVAVAKSQEPKLSEADERVLLFLVDQMRREDSRTLESTGLAEKASARQVVNTPSSFSTYLSKLKYYAFVESVRSGRVSLYSLTTEGYAEVKRIIDRQQANRERGDGDTMVSNRGTLEEQLKVGMEQGKLPNPYTAPQGLALPKEGTYSKDVTGLQALFKDRINTRADENELLRIKEWFEKLTANGQPAFYWVQEAIVKTSVKVKAEQRTIAYVIGILKSWSKYGYGADLNSEQRKLFDRFEDRFGVDLSIPARQKLMSLVDAYGIVDTVAALFQTEFAAVDISRLVVDLIDQRLTGSEQEEEETA